MSAPVAVISGGSRGLGMVLVERLLDQGWRVATFSRGASEFTDAMTEKHPDDFHWAPVDLADTAALRAFATAARRRFGAIDLLVNNAGVLTDQELFLTVPGRRIEDLIAQNLTAPITLTQACAKVMSAQRSGQIVNISSINAVRGFRGVAVYAAAKAGIDGFSRSLARELGPLNIRVNSVVPGFFDSGMTAAVTAENRERIQKRTPLGRLADIEEIANAVLFVISPSASFITGQTIIVDGGITC
ncbi:MAG TPA: SDR family oxidoreductase [Glycomyces sp.]